MDSYKNRKFRAHKELECVYYALQARNDAEREEDEKMHLEKIDDIKSKVLFSYFEHLKSIFNKKYNSSTLIQMILKLQEMTKDREDNMNDLWTEFQQVLRNYSERTEEKYAEYVEMRERDNADTKEIQQHYWEIAKATRDISMLKSIHEAQSNEHHIHMTQLNQYQELLKSKQKRMKTAMNSSEKTHKKLMKVLVVSSTDVNNVSH